MNKRVVIGFVFAVFAVVGMIYLISATTEQAVEAWTDFQGLNSWAGEIRGADFVYKQDRVFGEHRRRLTLVWPADCSMITDADSFKVFFSQDSNNVIGDHERDEYVICIDNEKVTFAEGKDPLVEIVHSSNITTVVVGDERDSILKSFPAPPEALRQVNEEFPILWQEVLDYINAQRRAVKRGFTPSSETI